MTIAKAMSAYDKDFSDAIYGKEDTGQYVCKSRLKKMITHEYQLMEERLKRSDHPNKKFFSSLFRNVHRKPKPHMQFRVKSSEKFALSDTNVFDRIIDLQ